MFYWGIQKLGILDTLPDIGKIVLPWIIYAISSFGVYKILRNPIVDFAIIENIQFLVSPVLHLLSVIYFPIMLVSGFKSALPIMLLFIQAAMFTEINVDLHKPKTGTKTAIFQINLKALLHFLMIVLYCGPSLLHNISLQLDIVMNLVCYIGVLDL